MSETLQLVHPAKRITIVIPVYGDWTSLRACVSSVIEHADSADYDVLLINDCGPEADEIEAGLLAMIYGHDQIRYERNPANLGFVRSCNRAVFELDTTENDILLLNSDAELTAGSLDELRAVLSLSEKHGVVCARSNDATIATIPFFQRTQNKVRGRERTREVFNAISAELPRYYVSPVSIGFCMLIRRSLINDHGLFDEIYGMGYNEENDFCLRINALGYSSLIANHALVFHVGSTSFGADERATRDAVNARILLRRYPFYPQAVTSFIRNDYSAIDRFADLLVPAMPAEPIKVLIDLHHISLRYDGSTRNALSFFEYLGTADHAGVALTVAAPAEAIAHFRLEKYGIRVIDYMTIDEVFDVGFAVAPVTALGQLVSLNRHCLRWVVSFLDIIALRSWALRTQVVYKPVVVRAALEHANTVIAITEATVNDAIDFLPGFETLPAERLQIIRQGSAATPLTPGASLSGAIAREVSDLVTASGYVLVVGNAFPHKQLRLAVAALDSGNVGPVIVLGDPTATVGYANVHAVESGDLPDADISLLYASASVVIFPSAYEGFGLPLAEAVDLGSPVVAFDTVVAREVTRELGVADSVTFFDSFAMLPEAVAVAAKRPRPRAGAVRQMRDYNADVWAAILATAQSPVDRANLVRRDSRVRELALILDDLGHRLDGAVAEVEAIKASRSFALARRITALRALIPRRNGPTVAGTTKRTVDPS